MQIIKRLLSMRVCLGMNGMWDSELKGTLHKHGQHSPVGWGLNLIKVGRTRKQMQMKAPLFLNGFLIAAVII